MSVSIKGHLRDPWGDESVPHLDYVSSNDDVVL